MYVSTSSKISSHLSKAEGILEEDSKTSFYSKSKNSYKKVLFKLLKMVDLLIGLFPEFSECLHDHKFENIFISTNRVNRDEVDVPEFNSKTSVEPSPRSPSLGIEDTYRTSECSHTCFFQSMCKFYQDASGSSRDLNSKDFTSDPALSISNAEDNVEGISNIFSSKKQDVKEGREKVSKDSHSSFYTQPSGTCNTNIEVNVSPVKKTSKTSRTRKEETNNHIDNCKSKYSLTSDLAVLLDSTTLDTDFEGLVTKNTYQRNNKELPSDIDEIIQHRADNFSYRFTSENSRDLYNIFSSIYIKEKTKDIKFAITWLNTLYIEKAKSPTSQKYFNPSGVPGKLISFILADVYYCNHGDDNRVWNELIHWSDRYDSKYRWAAPRCTSASVLKKLDITHDMIASAYRRWENMCYMFNTQTISEDSPLRLYPSQFLKKVRSLKILTDDELYALV